MPWKKTHFGKRRERKPISRNAMKKKTLIVKTLWKKTLFLSIIKFTVNSTVFN